MSNISKEEYTVGTMPYGELQCNLCGAIFDKLAEHECTAYSQAQLNKVDRFEVIDETGRVYVKGSIYGSPVSIKLSLQDDNRTLKVFVTSKESEE